MTHVHLLTSSRLRLWQSCARAHHYRYEVGLAAIGQSPAALAFGTAVHAGLESWWLSMQAGDSDRALAGALEAAESSITSARDGEADPYDLARLTAALCAYDARWHQWACGVDVIGVEMAFSYPLTHPITGESAETWRVAGKIDALLRLADGRVAILEHKTRTGDAGAGSDYRRRLTLDPQISTYFDGARALGWDADLCIYDVLVKPGIKPLLATPVESRKYTQGKAATKTRPAEEPRLYAGQRETDESPEEYRDRLIQVIGADPDKHLVHAEIVRTEDERHDHAWTLWHTARMITETRRAALTTGDVRAIPQSSHACFAHGGAGCEFLPVCEGTASARDTGRFTRMATVHPELETEGTNETA